MRNHFKTEGETWDRKFTTRSVARRSSGRELGFTLAEVVISIAVVGLVFSGVLTGYVQSARQAEWSGYSLAAEGFAVQQLEQARSAVWDTSLGKNDITNLNLINWAYNSAKKQVTGYTTNVLDLPYGGTNNYVQATNYVTITKFYFNGVSNPPVELQMIRVDTCWPFKAGKKLKYFTNSVATYLAPDNRDPSLF